MVKKAVFITGISEGVGKSLAMKFADRGDRVLGISRSKPLYLDSYKDLVFWREFDLSGKPDFGALKKYIITIAGKLDVVILNAAEAYYDELWSAADEKIRRIVEVNFLNIAYLLKYLIPIMVPGGQVVFVTSSAVNFPAPYMALYAASKAAQESIALSLNVEAMARRITFKIVRPGEIATNLAKKSGVPLGAKSGGMTLDAATVAEATITALKRNRLVTNVGITSIVMSALRNLGPSLLVKLSAGRHAQPGRRTI